MNPCLKQVKMKKEYLTKNQCQTKNLGKYLARTILKNPSKENAFILGLVGELGGGKTTFLQGFAKGLNVKEKILSPTFVIIKKYKIKETYYSNLYHIDCYRIKQPKELLELGFKKIVSDRQNIIAIEWADKIKRILPNDTSIITFKFINKNKRRIVFSAF